MLEEISYQEASCTYGGVAWVPVLVCIAGGAAIYKMVASPSGSFSFGGLKLTWGR